ncbi:MAG: polysaccharide pyruvyl transferase family protein [Pseudomonadota bacterium]
MKDKAFELPPRNAPELWLAQVATSPDPELTIREHCAALVSAAEPGAVDAFDGSRPLEILLVGYNGAGNLGADVRVAELIAQIAHLLGPVPARLRLVTVSPFLPPSLFPARIGACEIIEEQIVEYVPLGLERLVTGSDIVLACEGSMFKSTFSDTLSTIMFAAVAMARAHGKLAIAVGAEAGKMTPELEAFACASFADSPILARNARSRDQLAGLGLNAQTGADTAWSFAPNRADEAAACLADLGVDPARDLTIICPINPFWWPVHIDLARAASLTGPDPLHYGAGFFHADSLERRADMAAYIAAVADAMSAHVETTGSFLLSFGMERIDAQAVAELDQALQERGVAATDRGTLVSGEADPHVMVHILRRARLLVTSRFHAAVLAAGAAVPAIGVSLDERLKTLLSDAGVGDRVLPVKPAEIAARLPSLMAGVWRAGPRAGAPMEALARREIAAQDAQGLALRALMAVEFPALKAQLPALTSGLGTAREG